MRSSYIQNNLGEVLYNYVRAWKPLTCVELGVLDGYSTAWIAKGLKKNNLGDLRAYDLFEDYQFKHGAKNEVAAHLVIEGVSEYVTLIKQDAFSVSENYADNSVYFLHIDISNTGSIIKELVSQWHPKLVHGGLICIEGGTKERDEIEWMLKYEKAPIKAEIETNPILNSNYIYATHLMFPGLTVCLKKR